MEKINKCPMCRMHQIVVYSEDIHVSLEEAFDVLQEASLKHDTLQTKADLFDELVVAYRVKFSINDNVVSLMTLVDEFALKAEELK